MNVPILATGKDTAVYLDNTPVTKSAERLRNDILSTDEMRLKKALSDEADFIKAMSVDPVALMTQAGIEQQAADIESYNDKWAKIMSQNRGVMSTDMKIQMQKDRVGLESRQQNLAANQQRALQEMQLYQSNPSKYDSKLFEDSFLNFLSTGEYTTGLTKKRGMLSDALDTDRKTYFATKPPEVFGSSKSKDGQIVNTNFIGDEKEGARRVLNLLTNHEDADAYLEDAAGDFFQQSDEVQRKYLDSNKDGQISEDEIQALRDFGNAATIATNPIVRWAMDNYGAGYKRQKDTPKNRPGGGSSSAQTVIPSPMNQPYQISNTTTFSEYYPLEGKPESLTISEGAKMVTKRKTNPDGIVINKGGDEEDVPRGSRIFDGDIVGYSKDRDMVVIRPTTGKGGPETADVILVPRKDLPKTTTDKYRINYKGKTMTINEAAGAASVGSTAVKPKAY